VRAQEYEQGERHPEERTSTRRHGGGGVMRLDPLVSMRFDRLKQGGGKRTCIDCETCYM